MMKQFRSVLKLAVSGIFFFSLAGCVSISTEGASQISLFRDDGKSPNPDVLQKVQSEDYRDGIVFEIKADDIVFVTVEKSGEIFQVLDAEPIKIKFKQDIFAYVNERGIYASLDGVKFAPLSDLVSGSLAVGFSMEESVRKNQLAVRIALRHKGK